MPASSPYVICIHLFYRLPGIAQSEILLEDHSDLIQVIVLQKFPFGYPHFQPGGNQPLEPSFIRGARPLSLASAATTFPRPLTSQTACTISTMPAKPISGSSRRSFSAMPDRSETRASAKGTAPLTALVISWASFASSSRLSCSKISGSPAPESRRPANRRADPAAARTHPDSPGAGACAPGISPHRRGRGHAQGRGH